MKKGSDGKKTENYQNERFMEQILDGNLNLIYKGLIWWRVPKDYVLNFIEHNNFVERFFFFFSRRILEVLCINQRTHLSGCRCKLAIVFGWYRTLFGLVALSR
jgi:hypothetical protein